MFLRAKVHFFSEPPKLLDENCKKYQELLIYLSGRHLTRGSWYPQPASKRQKNLPRDDLAGEVFIYGLDDY